MRKFQADHGVYFIGKELRGHVRYVSCNSPNQRAAVLELRTARGPRGRGLRAPNSIYPKSQWRGDARCMEAKIAAPINRFRIVQMIAG